MSAILPPPAAAAAAADVYHVPADIENGVVTATVTDDSPNGREDFSLPSILLAFCFSSMLSLLTLFSEMATAPAPAPDLAPTSSFPLLVYLLALATSCTFVSIFVAKIIGLSTPLGKPLVRVGYTFAALSFFLGISVFSPAPLWLTMLFWSIFVIGLLVALKYYTTSPPATATATTSV